MSPNGIAIASKTIRGIFDSLAQAPMARQLAEMEAALKTAQTSNAQSSADYHAARAGQENYTLERRKAIPKLVAEALDLPQYRIDTLTAFGNTGDTNMERYAQASGLFQKQQNINDIQSGGIADPTRTSQAYQAVGGGPTFDNVGTSGYAQNRITGEAIMSNPALASLFGFESQAQTAKDHAYAQQSRAAAEKYRSDIGVNNAQIGKYQADTEKTRSSINAAGTGKPRTPAKSAAWQPSENSMGTPARIETKADYRKLPSGARYVAPDGAIRIKP